MNKHYVRIVLLFITVAVMTFFLSGCISPSGISKDEVKKKMTEYLKSTYNKEFVVEEPQLTGNEGFGYNVYQAYAYPSDDTKMRFRVIWEKGEPGIFDDGYIDTLWRNPAMKEFNELLNDIYGKNVFSIYGFNFNFKRYGKDINDVKDLTYSDVIKKYPDKILIDMKYYVFVDGSIDKREEAEKAYRVLKQHVLDKNIDSFSLIVNFMSDDFREEFDKNIDSVRLGRKGFERDTLHNNGKLINSIMLVDLEDDYINYIIKKFVY